MPIRFSVVALAVVLSGSSPSGANTGSSLVDRGSDLVVDVPAMIEALWRASIPEEPPIRFPEVCGVAFSRSMSPEELVHYWVACDQEPPWIERLRLLDACRERPELLPSILGRLPTTSAAVDLVRRYQARKPLPELDAWLLVHDLQRTSELSSQAKSPGPEVVGERLHRWMVTLAERDWHATVPILREHARRGGEAGAVASIVVHGHLLRAQKNDELSGWRRKLQSASVDPQLTSETRSLALSALMQEPWAERERWFIGHLATLREATSLARLLSVVRREPDLWVERIVPLAARVDSADRRALARRQVAIELLVAYLATTPDPRAARALMPWLTLRTWAQGDALRLRYIASLAHVPLPEALPGLFQPILRSVYGPDYRQPPDVVVATAKVLRRYCRKRLRAGMQRAVDFLAEGEVRREIQQTMHTCGMFNEFDQATAIVRYAQHLLARKAALRKGESVPAMTAAAELGSLLVEPQNSDLPLALQRVRWVRDTERNTPVLAPVLLDLFSQWSAPPISRDLVARLNLKEVTLPTLRRAIEGRQGIRDLASPGLRDLAGTQGPLAGVAALLLGDRTVQAAMLASHDTQAIEALLAAARYAREWLPDEGLRAAASAGLGSHVHRYLQEVGIPEARRYRQAGCHRNGQPTGFSRTMWRRASRRFPDLPRWSSGRAEELWRVEQLVQGRPQGRISLERQAGQFRVRVQRWRGRSFNHAVPAKAGLDFVRFFERYAFDIAAELDGLAPNRRLAGQGPRYRITHARRACASRFVLDRPGAHARTEPKYQALLARFEVWATGFRP